MSDNWNFYPCSMGDDEAFIYLDLGVRDSICEASPNNLAKLRLEYKKPRENGLPTQDEFEPVSKIEDIIEDFAESHEDWYVGRITVAGHRYFYIYTSRDEDAWKTFLQSLCSDSGYDIRLSFREDRNAEAYLNDLYPTPDDWQVIKDLQVIKSLEKHGDDGSEPRQVDHWVYFDSKADSVDFLIWAEHDRFEEDAEHSGERDDGKYCVRLRHTGTIKLPDITSHTIALRRKAEEFGGDYDGWETQVIKKEG